MHKQWKWGLSLTVWCIIFCMMWQVLSPWSGQGAERALAQTVQSLPETAPTQTSESGDAAQEQTAQRETEMTADAQATWHTQEIAAGTQATWHTQEMAADAQATWHTQEIAADAQATWHTQEIAADAQATWHTQEIAADAQATWHTQEIAADAQATWHTQEIAADAQATWHTQEMAADAQATQDTQKVVALTEADTDFAGESADAADVLAGTDEASGYAWKILDAAGLLSEAERTALAEDMKPLLQYGSVGFFTDNQGAMPTAQRAEQLCEMYLQGDRAQGESGTLFLIDMAERQIYIYSWGTMHRTITNAYATTITDNVYAYASDEAYYKCAKEAFLQELTLLQGHRIAQPMKYISNLLLALMLAMLLNYLLVRASSGAKQPSAGDLAAAIHVNQTMGAVDKTFVRETRKYSPQSSGGGGGGSHGGGGGHSGGGGGGHRF